MFTRFKNKVMLISLLLASFVCHSTGNSQPMPNASAEEVEMLFWDMQNLKEAYINAAPIKLRDNIKVGKIGVDGGDKAPILQFAKELAENKYGKYDSLLISHKGKLLFESYFNRGRADLPHFQFSATKGFTSLVLARALQLGYITMADLNKPLISFFKELDSSKLADGIEKVTLHHLLSMRSGLRFSDEQLQDFREDREKYSGIAEVQAFLEFTQPITKESQVYKYQAPDPILVMHVLNEVVPGTAKEFIETEFLNKMGIRNYEWKLGPKALPKAESGLNLTSRDMLKIGGMLINKGRWENEQLISEKYLTVAFKALTKPTESWHPDNFNYGYFWYQTDIVLNNKIYDVNLAWGAGGNRIIVVEALDLVIAITGHDIDDVVFEPLAKAILPAFIDV